MASDDDGNHTCHFCGTELNREGYELGDLSKRHWTEDCRPDLVEHEPGPLCTWPDDPEANKYREPWCYWDHEKGELRAYGSTPPSFAEQATRVR